MSPEPPANFNIERDIPGTNWVQFIGRSQELPNRRRPFAVPIADQHAMADQHAVVCGGKRATV